MKRSVSEELETTRKNTIEELGNNSGLADPDFLDAFRKASNKLEEVMTTEQTKSQAVEGHHGVRGFAEFELTKKELGDYIGDQLTSHKKLLNAIRGSTRPELF